MTFKGRRKDSDLEISWIEELSVASDISYRNYYDGTNFIYAAKLQPFGSIFEGTSTSSVSFLSNSETS